MAFEWLTGRKSSSSKSNRNAEQHRSTDAIGAFQAVDRDGSGFVSENELQRALSSAFYGFNLKTVRLLMFLFNKSGDPRGIGAREFAALWSCLVQWREIFERYDRDRSGRIDLFELRDAFYSLGYALPPSVFKIFMSKYDTGSNEKIELDFGTFIECGMIVKAMTDKFIEKDARRSGSATFSHDEFLALVIPYVVQYD